MNELSIFYDKNWNDIYDNIRFEKYSFSYKVSMHQSILMDSCEVFIGSTLLFDYGKDDTVFIEPIKETILYYICQNLARILGLTPIYVRDNIHYKRSYGY